MKQLTYALISFLLPLLLQAGQDGGGTYAICNRTLESYHFPMQNLNGYKEFDEQLKLIGYKLPYLANHLRKVENLNWFYFQANKGCKFIPAELKRPSAPLEIPFEVTEPVRMVAGNGHVFVRGDLFDQLHEPETSLLHEAARMVCSWTYGWKYSLRVDGCTVNLALILQNVNQATSAEDLREKIGSATRPINMENVGQSRDHYVQDLDKIAHIANVLRNIMAEYDRLLEVWTTHFEGRRERKCLRFSSQNFTPTVLTTYEIAEGGGGQMIIRLWESSGSSWTRDIDNSVCTLTLESPFLDLIKEFNLYVEHEPHLRSLLEVQEVTFTMLSSRHLGFTTEMYPHGGATVHVLHPFCSHTYTLTQTLKNCTLNREAFLAKLMQQHNLSVTDYVKLIGSVAGR